MIILILLLSLGVRLISLNQSLWLDEAISVLAVKDNSFIGVITRYIGGDFHPPGYYLLLDGWTKIFGYSEIAVRLPSVLFGVGTVFLVYLIGKKLFNERIGLLGALLLALNPLHVYYSQEARMYSLACFAVSLSFFYLIKLIKHDRGVFWGLVISFILILGSDYVAYLIIPVELIVVGFNKDIRVLKKWILALIIGCLVWVWFLPIFFQQVHLGSNLVKEVPGWASVVGSSGLKPLGLTFIKFIIGRVSFANKDLYASIFIPIGILFLFLVAYSVSKLKKEINVLLLSWLLIPILLGLFISIFIPIYDYFRVLFVLPSFVLLVSLGIINLNRKIFKLVLPLVVGVELVFSLMYLFVPQYQREDWKGLSNFLENNSNGRVILEESSGDFAPITYYKKNEFKTLAALNNFPAKESSDVIDLNSNLKNKNSVFLLQYLVDISDPKRLVTQGLEEQGFKLVRIYNFNGVGFLYQYDRQIKNN